MTTQTIVKCANCNGLNAHALPFCMFCGSSLVGTDDVKLISPRPCNACSVVNPLSQKYCVSCGATMNPSREHTALVQQKPALASTSHRLNLKEKKRQTQHKTRRAIIGASVAAAVTSLCIAGGYFYSQNQIAQNTGMLVYASPSGADVFVEDSHNCLVRSGKIKANGELLLKGMAAGRYSLTVSKLGYKPNEQSVVLVPNKIASIGIPERIDLLSLDHPVAPATTTSSAPAIFPNILAGKSEQPKIKSFQPAKIPSSAQTSKAAQSNYTIKAASAEKKPSQIESSAEASKTSTEAGPKTTEAPLQGSTELATNNSINETATLQAPQNEEPFIPNKFMRRRMQNPHIDRRFSHVPNGPFRAIGYPVVIPPQGSIDQTRVNSSFNEPSVMPLNKRIRPNMRQFIELIQSDPVRRTDEIR